MAQDTLNGTVMQNSHCTMISEVTQDQPFMMGDGAITSLSRKQGMNTRSSTKVVEKPLLTIGLISYLQRSRWSCPLLCFPSLDELLDYMYLSQLMSIFTKLSKSALSSRWFPLPESQEPVIQQSHMYSLIHWLFIQKYIGDITFQ